MRIMSSLSLILFGIVVCLKQSSAEAPASGPQDERVRRLIDQMGSNHFQEREEAARALDRLGSAALDELQTAVRNEDPEINCRALALVQKIQKRMETAQILAPQRLRFVCQDKPLVEALADLKQKTGLPLELSGDKAKHSARRIDLDTGETTVWEAFDQFCQKAGICEHDPFSLDDPPNGSDAKAQQAERQILVKRQLAAVQMMQQRGNMPVGAPQGPMILVEGKAKVLPTCYAGAVRIRAVPASSLLWSQPVGEEETLLALEAMPEPRIQWQNVVNVRIDRAVDENDQALSPSGAFQGIALSEPNVQNTLVVNGSPGFMQADQRLLPVRLKLGKNPSKRLKKLQGSIAVQVQTPAQPLLTVDHILKAAGQTVTSSEGTSLKVIEVSRQSGGDVMIRAQLENQLAGVNLAGGAVAVRGGIRVVGAVVAPQVAEAGPANLSLVNDRGKPFRLVNLKMDVAMANGAGMVLEMTLTYRPHGPGEAAKLIFSGPKAVVIEVPFDLKDVPLPSQEDSARHAATPSTDLNAVDW